MYSEHPGKEFGKFVTSAGGFYNDAENDKGKGVTLEATPIIHLEQCRGPSLDTSVIIFLSHRVIVILNGDGLNVLCGTSDSPLWKCHFCNVNLVFVCWPIL